MADFAYTTVPGKIKPLLAKFREVGIPPKVTVQWLKGVGFTSSNDKTLIPVIKQIGLIDQSVVPTSNWAQYRGADHKALMGRLIRSGYADLFSIYPDAQTRSQQEIEHVFSTVSSAGKQVIGKTVSTFKALCELATFAANDEDATVVATGPLHHPVASPTAVVPQLPESFPPQGKIGPSLHIDMQIHIAPESSPEQIDQIFKSMAKHLYGAPDKA